MRKIKAGAKVGKDKICMLLYVDDVVVMSQCWSTAKAIRCGRGLWKRFWRRAR